MAGSGFERRSLELLVDAHNELSQGVNSLGEKEALASRYRRCVGRRRKLRSAQLRPDRAGGASNE